VEPIVLLVSPLLMLPTPNGVNVQLVLELMSSKTVNVVLDVLQIVLLVLTKTLVKFV